MRRLLAWIHARHAPVVLERRVPQLTAVPNGHPERFWREVQSWPN